MDETSIEQSKDTINARKDFTLSKKEMDGIRQAISGQNPMTPELMAKIESDPVVAEFGIAVFFPVIGDRIINGETPKVESINANTRGRGFKATFKDGAYITKPLENSEEVKIAKAMAEIGVGPEQFESLPGYITEQFAEGVAVSKLAPERCTPEFMQELGAKIAEAIKKVHDKGILINDQLLADDFSKSHTIVGADGKICFIDFGASIDLNDYPNISDEAVRLIMRSDGIASMSLGMATPENIGGIISDYRNRRLSLCKTKKEVIARYDGQLLNEGLSFLSDRIGHDAVVAMISGIKAAGDI